MHNIENLDWTQFEGNQDIALMLLFHIHRKSNGKWVKISRQQLTQLANNRYRPYLTQFESNKWITINNGYHTGIRSKSYLSLLEGEVYPLTPTSKTGQNKLQTLLSLLPLIGGESSENNSTLLKSDTHSSISLFNVSGFLSIPQQWEVLSLNEIIVDGYRNMIRNGKIDAIDVTHRRYGARQFQIHGRAYHSYQCRSDVRRMFTIDKERMVEVDIKASHPWIAGHVVNMPIDPNNFYESVGEVLDNGSTGTTSRDIVKQCVMRLFNAHHSNEMYRDMLPLIQGTWVGEYVKRVRSLSKDHKGDNNRFAVLGRKEGKLVERTREILMQKQVPLYTVHDCVGVPCSQAEIAKEALHQSAMEQFGPNNGLIVTIG